MNKNNVTIRPATIDDTENILKIYAFYVLNTAISFEYTVPPLNEFKSRIEKILKRYPCYVAVKEKNNIAGYAYAGAFNEREAYKYSVELSIYVDKAYKKQGIGKLLYKTLEQDLKAQKITNLYARIAVPEKEDEYLNFNSAQFHEHLGFKKVGEFHRCGYKFNRWYNIICMEKFLKEH